MKSKSESVEFFDTVRALDELSELLNIKDKDIEEKLNILEAHITKLKYVDGNHEGMMLNVLLLIDTMRYRCGFIENFNLH